MENLKRAVYLAILLLVFSMQAYAQDKRVDFIADRLKQLSETDAPGLKEKVAVSVSSVSVAEFIRGIAISNNLNISVDPNVKLKITVNFTDETVMNILVFLCKQYNIDIKFTGSIMYVSEYTAPAPVVAEREIPITFDTANNTISIDARNDTLYKVVKKIIQLSGTNIVAAPDVNNKIVTVYVSGLPLSSALEKLAFANQIQLTKNEDSTYYLSSGAAQDVLATATKKGADAKKAGANGKVPEPDGDFSLKVEKDATGQDLVTVSAVNAPIQDMIKYICQQLKVDYFLFSDIQGKTTVNVTALPFDRFLDYVLKGTDYDFKTERGIYLIGARVQEGFTMSKVIQLQYRTTDVVIDHIPADLKKGLEVKDFPELNSIIASGPVIKVAQLDSFIKSIDKVVPVIMIEVIIADVSSSHTVSTGLKAGISDQPVKTQGTVFPNVDITLGSGGLNDVLKVISGAGLVNLGQVAPNFYVSLKLLEEQGALNVRSTPRLSTLNGHEANMTIGKTDYYLEQTNNIIGTQNPQTVVTQTYKPINADFSLTINPTVSGDDQVTMEITVKQSDFTQRISPNAPPGTTKRDFKSMIRVKNDDMIVLGGLEQNSSNDSGSGVPLLSRIPVLKWFFSSRDKSKSKSKLTIFIRPTIIY